MADFGEHFYGMSKYGSVCYNREMAVKKRFKQKVHKISKFTDMQLVMLMTICDVNDDRA